MVDVFRGVFDNFFEAKNLVTYLKSSYRAPSNGDRLHNLLCNVEGLQAVVQQSTILPHVGLVQLLINRCRLLFLSGFTKPLLAYHLNPNKGQISENATTTWILQLLLAKSGEKTRTPHKLALQNAANRNSLRYLVLEL